MIRIAFFGMHGAFSTVPLEALAQSGMEIALVVLGTDRRAGLRASPELLRATPSFWDRQMSRLRGPEAPRPHDLIQTAHDRGIDVVRTSWANDGRVVRRLAERAPNAYVVSGFPHLLSPEVLAIPKRGGLNLHPGALPEERGPAPLFWALKEGRTTIRWTIHMLTEQEDAGDVVSKGEITFQPGTHGQDILRAVSAAAAPWLIRALRSLFAGDIVRTPQSRNAARRRRRPRFRDGLVDTQRSAEEVFTFVSGCARSYSLFVESADDRFFIDGALSYDPLAQTDYDWVLTGDRLLLRCHPGVVELQLKADGALFAAEYDEPTHRVRRGV